MASNMNGGSPQRRPQVSREASLDLIQVFNGSDEIKDAVPRNNHNGSSGNNHSSSGARPRNPQHLKNNRSNNSRNQNQSHSSQESIPSRKSNNTSGSGKSFDGGSHSASSQTHRQNQHRRINNPNYPSSHATPSGRRRKRVVRPQHSGSMSLSQPPLNNNDQQEQRTTAKNVSRARSADLTHMYQQETSNQSSQIPPRPKGGQRTRSTSGIASNQQSSSASKGSLLSYLSYNSSKDSTPQPASDEISRADMFLESVGRLQKNNHSQLSGYLQDSYASQSNSHAVDEAEDEATVMTLHRERRRQERDKRRETMRDRMRRERTHQSSSDRPRTASKTASRTSTIPKHNSNSTQPPSRPKIQVEPQQAATPAQPSETSPKGPPRFQMLKQPSARNLPYEHDESESSVDMELVQQQHYAANQLDNPNEQSQRSARQENIFYVSSDNDNSVIDDDDEEEEYYAGGDDDGTVLQFDPTQTDNVFLVKQFHNSESECEVNNTDGSHSVLSISELKDPMSEAAQHNMSGNLGQKPIFDFLERDDDDEEEEAEKLPSNNNSYKGGSGHTATSTASTSLSTSRNNINNNSLDLNSSGDRNKPRGKAKKKRAGNKLVQDAQKYSQFFKSNYLTNGVRLPNTRKGPKESEPLEGQSEVSRRKSKPGGKKKTRRPVAQNSQTSTGLDGTETGAKESTANPLRASRKMVAQNHIIHNNVDDTSSDDEEATSSIPHNHRLNSLNDLFPAGNSDIPSQLPADPPSGTSSVSGGSLVAPSGGESVSTTPSTPSKRRGLRFGKGSKQSRVAAADKPYDTDHESRRAGSSSLADIAVNHSGNASDVPSSSPSKKIGGLGIGRYFARSGSSARADTPESDRDDDDNRSIMSSLSRGLFNRNRAVGPEGHAILLGDDSSSYGESSSANTR